MTPMVFPFELSLHLLKAPWVAKTSKRNCFEF